MSSWSEFIYFFIFGAALLLSLMGLWFTAVIPGIDRWSKRFFLSYFSVFMLCYLAALIEAAFQYYLVPQWAFRFVLMLECLLLSLPLPMLTVFLLHNCGENIRSSRLLHAVAGLWAIYCVQSVSSLFIEGFTYITPENHYYRGPLYQFPMLIILAILLLTFAGTIRRRNQLSPKVFNGLLVALLPMTFSLIVHIFVDVFSFINISYILSALSMYSIILSDQIEQDMRHQREIANQRTSIMVLQMRPHFIYNTMTSIYCLCSQDPEKAQQVVLDFTNYLRKNFTAVASTAPIPFTSELEHTRAYLAVEQAQYSKSLLVEYDTPHTFFRVPPLTLQPIVENAVKHGRDPYAGPLRISIRTRKTTSGSEITVSDNGCGFDLSDDSEPHIALKNIQQRLELMCDGSLTITSNDGGGTVVTVTIPD